MAEQQAWATVREVTDAGAVLNDRCEPMKRRALQRKIERHPDELRREWRPQERGGPPTAAYPWPETAEALGLIYNASAFQIPESGKGAASFPPGADTGEDGQQSAHDVDLDTDPAVIGLMGRAAVPSGFAFDARAKNPRYLIRNGSDGAIVNQLPGRVHAIAAMMGDAATVCARLDHVGLGADPVVPKIRLRSAYSDTPILLHISTRDIHVGEPGDPREYHDEITDRVSETLQWAAHAHGRIDCVLLTLASDWNTIDTIARTTTKGTAIPGTHDVYDVLAWSERLAVDVVELCRQASPRVVAIAEQGNHDAVTGIATARTVSAWFRNCDDVEIIIPVKPDGTGLATRTAFEWHDIAIFGHHGHIKSPTQLPQIIAAEFAPLWGRARRRYILLGHRHHTARWPVGDRNGVEVIQTRSPSRQTDYEHRLGFVGDPESLESFVFAPGKGLITHRRA